MLKALRNLFGKKKSDYAKMVKEGAVILDVRSSREFTGGHIKGSVNIPVDSLINNLGKLKDKNQPIITCCASGMRSAAAKNILLSAGYTNVRNGGSWKSLNNKIKL